MTEASIKRFETTGQISFHSLLRLAFTLDCMDEFDHLFAEKPPRFIEDLQRKPRQRGRV
ncbi:MAG: hypothetical protein R3E95_24020 [Thiolinea sp.]